MGRKVGGGLASMAYPYNGILRQYGFQSLRHITTRFYWAFFIYCNHPSNLYKNSQYYTTIIHAFVLHFVRLWFTIHSQHFLQFSPTYPPISHLHPSDHPSNGQWEDSEWLTSRQCLCPVGALSSDYSPKDMVINWACSFSGGDRSPSNTMSPGPRPTSVPSGILIHPVVWPQ